MVVGIIGAGPAGIACASILARYQKDVLLFEGRAPGGLLNNARWVENFPGLQPMSGEELVDQLKISLRHPHITLIFEKVVQIQKHRIQTTTGQIYKVDRIVLATGTQPKIMEDWPPNPRVVYEWRDVPKDIHILGILGAGDAAFDSGLSGLDRKYKVYLWNRSDRMKAIPILYRSFIQAGGVYFEEEPIQKIHPFDNGLSIQTGNRSMNVDVLLVSIGREKKPIVEMDLADPATREIGDYAHPHIRQASIAIGDGMRVGLEIILGQE
ncbi:NAD(P)/FAD-dependent oxidoreductase [bacterium]|nr:NAD(P)/FAD-dependent oxidoreductase [bacterium]